MNPRINGTLKVLLQTIGICVYVACTNGCSSNSDADSDNDTDSHNDSDVETDAGIDDASHFEDCDNLPSLPKFASLMDHFPSSEDFVFDNEGYVIQVTDEDSSVVKKTTYSGESTIIAPFVSDSPQGTRLLPTGEIVVTNAEKNELVRVYPNGGSESFANGISGPNGLAVDMDGFIYATSAEGKIYRVDPVANTFEAVLEYENVSFDGITFSPDYKTLYFNEEIGNVYRATVNDDGTLSEDRLLVNVIDELAATASPDILEFVDILDGMTIDICGNLYVVAMSGTIIRINPNGETKVAVQVGRDEDTDFLGMLEMIPAVNFGSGKGGWKSDHLYILSFMGGIYEADMGVPGKPEPHL